MLRSLNSRFLLQILLVYTTLHQCVTIYRDVKPGYSGRSLVWPMMTTTVKPNYETDYEKKYNETKIYESEYYEPNYCEYILVEEITKAAKYIVVSELDGKFDKLKKNRYAIKVTSVVAELVYDALYDGNDLIEAIAKGLKAQYALIPGIPAGDIKNYEADRFEAKVTYAIKDVLNGICKQRYCCLESYDRY